MPKLKPLRLAACLALFAGLVQAASAADILIVDAKSQPESMTVAPGGVLFVGSASTPFVYKVPAGSTTPQKFVDASADGPGTFFFGMLADAATNTLWTCELTPVPGVKPSHNRSALRGFDITTGTQKLRWDLPGDDTTCNDFSIGPDKALYISDTANGRIYRLPAGASAAELFVQNRALYGIDGITFLNGVLYANTVFAGNLYRIPVDASGKAGVPVSILLDRILRNPDGMRAVNGKIISTENAVGKIDVITIDGDKATVKTIKEGLSTPTGVEPAGDTLWIAERGAGKAVSMPMPKW